MFCRQPHPAVARELGMSRPTVYRRMRVLGIEAPL
ncbi:helix-turn-helix domain-containing protein [Stutzerimonas stutzeri]